jgi:hypothetical protein
MVVSNLPSSIQLSSITSFSNFAERERLHELLRLQIGCLNGNAGRSLARGTEGTSMATPKQEDETAAVFLLDQIARRTRSAAYSGRNGAAADCFPGRWSWTRLEEVASVGEDRPDPWAHVHLLLWRFRRVRIPPPSALVVLALLLLRARIHMRLLRRSMPFLCPLMSSLAPEMIP